MHKCWCNSEGFRNFALLVGRVVVGAIFIFAGWSKFQNVEMVTGMFEGWGFPAATFFVWVTALVEFVGGIGLVLGIFTRLWALLLAVTMLVALLAVHVPQGHDFKESMQLPLVLLAVNLVLSSIGGGDWKVWSKECSWS